MDVASSDSSAFGRALDAKQEEAQRLGTIHSNEVDMLLRLKATIDGMVEELAAAKHEVRACMHVHC